MCKNIFSLYVILHSHFTPRGAISYVSLSSVFIFSTCLYQIYMLNCMFLNTANKVLCHDCHNSSSSHFCKAQQSSHIIYCMHDSNVSEQVTILVFASTPHPQAFTVFFGVYVTLEYKLHQSHQSNKSTIKRKKNIQYISRYGIKVTFIMHHR